MNHNELLVGLEERYGAVGHDIRLHSVGYDVAFDGSPVSEWSRIYCANCQVYVDVVSGGLSSWRVEWEGRDMLAMLDNRCVGVVTKQTVDVALTRAADAMAEWDDAQAHLGMVLVTQEHQRQPADLHTDYDYE